MYKKLSYWRSYGLLVGALPGLLLAMPLSPVGAASPLDVAPAQVVAQGAKLTVVAGNGIQNQDPSIGVLDYNDVDLLDSSHLDHDFVLRNDNKVPIVISRLQPSCGCTTVLPGEGNELPVTLAPGGQLKIQVSVDITRFRGPVQKTIQVYGSDAGPALATLEITATITDPITFLSPQVDFGRVPTGAKRSVSLTARLSPRLIAKGIMKLVSSNPDVAVTHQTPKPGQGGGNASTGGAAAPRLEQYTITVSEKAPLGPVMGTLAFALPNGAMPAAPRFSEGPDPRHPATSGDTALDAVLEGAMVPIMGEVVGSIAATPNLVFFGTIKGNKQQVLLTGSAHALKHLKIAAASPWVLTKLIPSNPALAAVTNTAATSGTAQTPISSVVLELSLSPKTPIGSLSTQITITTEADERLSLPVTAYVTPTPPAPPQ